MNLEDFIAQALTEINAGILKAKEALKPTGTEVIPPIAKQDVHLTHRQDHGRIITLIEFEVLLSVENTADAKGKATFKIFQMGAELGADKSKKQTDNHRIKFSVPIAYPDKSI